MVNNFMTNSKIKIFSKEKLAGLYSSVGQGAVDLVVNLIAMIMVERSLDHAGLGIFSFILSIYFTIGYLAEFGIPGYLEKNIASTDSRKKRTELTMKALFAIRFSGLIAMVFFFTTAFKDTSLTTIEDSTLIYFVIGLSIPVRNINRLKLALLQGTGLHPLVAQLRIIKRTSYLGCLFLLLLFRINPQILVFALILPELVQMVQLKRRMNLPGMLKTGLQLKKAVATLRDSKSFLFIENTFETILYLDFLILGMFVSSAELGIYTTASILAKFFLLIPVSIKPVIRNMFCTILAKNAFEEFSLTANRLSTYIFFINALFALYMLLFFQSVLGIFFTDIDKITSFNIFTVILPGLLFFSNAVTKEPLYEALDRQRSLQSLAILIFLINLFLNIYLVPFAGVSGAASATMISTLLFFIINEIKLNRVTQTSFYSWFLAGVWIYVFYRVGQYTSDFPVLTFLFLPPVLFICLFITGFFDYSPKSFFERGSGKIVH